MSSELLKLVSDDKVIEFQNMDKFLEIVNQNPPEAWLENHPLAKGVKYLPIERVEWMLDKMFQEWHVEVLREGTIFNSIYCAVRLHYKHPLKDWTYQDGVAAVPAKTDQGAAASDMSKIKSEAVMTGLPAAKSFAIKDAADHIGKVFGRDVNRKNNLEFIGSYTLSESEVLTDKIKNAKTEEDLNAVMAEMSAEDKRAFASSVKHRLEEIRNGSDGS